MTKKGRRGSARIARRSAARAAAETLLVFCEGEVTERHYLTELRRSLRAGSVTVAREHGVPKTLVELAVSAKRAGEADHIWCVFDVDSHPKLADALVQARDNGIPVAISNPCFELWALLHFADKTAWVDRVALRRQLQVHLPGYEKRLPFNELEDNTDEACARAQALAARHIGNGGRETDNPSTGVWQLVELIRSLRTAPS